MSIAGFSIRCRLLWAVALAVGFILTAGCDSVPGLEGQQRRPTVSELQVVTDSIEISEEDSLAQVDVLVAARAEDSDGTVDRVVFTIEPASNPRGTASGELSAFDDSRYGGRVRMTIPLAREVYTVRVFAIDDDDLASNQVVGQFAFDPDAHASGSSVASAMLGTARSTVQRP